MNSPKAAMIWHSYHFWLLLVVFAACTIFHYVEQIGLPQTLPASFHFGLIRHAVDRVLFLFPILYSSLTFGLVAGLGTAVAAVLAMLPRLLLISPSPIDSVLEMAAVIAFGVLACLWLDGRKKVAERRTEELAALESAHQQLQGHIRMLRSSESRLATLNAISTVLTESLELKEVLRRAIDLVMKVMDVEIVLIFSLDEETQELVITAYECVSDEFVQAVDRMKIGEGFNGRVAETGEPLVVEDASSDPRLTRPAVRQMKLQTQVIVPLKSKGRVVGTLCVAMRRPREFLPEEIDLLTAIGNQIGIAIENARLYEKERLTSERLVLSERNYRGLFENANDAIWVHDLEGNMVTANEATARLTGYDLSELTKMNIRELLSQESQQLAAEMQHKILSGEAIQPYDQRLIKKDGAEAIIKLATVLITSDGQPTGFHHIARDVTAEVRMQENLQYYLNQITNAQEEERKRIARELHDDTAQALYAISRQVDNFIRSNANLAANNVSFLKEIGEHINGVLEGVRRSTQALRPPMLDHLGLLTTLRWLLGDLEKQYGIETVLRALGNERRLSPEAELILFRIVQEALRNVERHAQASKVEVVAEFGKGKTKVSISDNGKGFDISGSFAELPREGKLGLAGMEERVRLLDGSFKVQSEPGRGTLIIIEAPI